MCASPTGTLDLTLRDIERLDARYVKVKVAQLQNVYIS